MSDFGDKSVASVKESASRSALEASTKLSELFMEAATNKVDQQSFRAEMDEKLKDVLPSLSIVSFQKDGLIKYDTDGDGAVSDKEMDAAIKSDSTSQKDKLMLTHLAKQYEVLKNQNQQDGKDGKNANGITNKDVETYLSNNPTDKALLSKGNLTRNYGTWQETVQPDGTIVKKSGETVFQYVPQGDYSKFSNIEDQEKTRKITINGKEVQLGDGDKATMDEKGAVAITHADKTSEVHHADGTVEKKNDKGELVEITGCGIHAVRDSEGKWYVPGDPNANPPTKDTYLKENTKPERAEDGSITLDFGSWQQKNLPDGTIIKTADNKVFQYVPQGDWSKCSDITPDAEKKILVNGQKIQLADGDTATIAENGDVTITHSNPASSEVHHANGIVEKKNKDGDTVEIEGNGVHAVRNNEGQWYIPGDKNAKPPTPDMYLAKDKKPEIEKDGSIYLDFGDWQQRNLHDGTIVKTAGGKVFQYVPQGDWDQCVTFKDPNWVDKDGNPTDVKDVQIDEKHNVTVTHKDGSYEIHHPDGSYEIYDECGTKKCDVDAETAKATNDKKSELQELSKIESGKGPYDCAKKMLEAAGVSPLTHKMILQFARWLRDEVAHKKSFKTGEQLVDDNDWQRVANKINEMKTAQKK